MSVCRLRSKGVPAKCIAISLHSFDMPSTLPRVKIT